MRRRLVWLQSPTKPDFPPGAWLAEPLWSDPDWWDYKLFRKLEFAFDPPPPITIDLPLRADGIDTLPPYSGQIRPSNDWVFFGNGDDDPSGSGGFSLYYSRDSSGISAILTYHQIADALGGVATLYPWELSNTGVRPYWDADWCIADFRYNKNPGDPLLSGSVILDRTGVLDLQTSPTFADLTHYIFPDKSLAVPFEQRLGNATGSSFIRVCSSLDRSKVLWRTDTWRVAYQGSGPAQEMVVADPRLSDESVLSILGGWSLAWDANTTGLFVAGSGPENKSRRLRIEGNEIWLDSEIPYGWPSDENGMYDGKYIEHVWIDQY
jgi:hypothetical protein